MLAVDTNILVRFVVKDDPRQAEAARDLLANETTFISSTVLLETEWVLRSSYRFPKAGVLAALKAICALPGTVLDEPERVRTAIDWADGGMDFADAIHIAGAADCNAFVTFDRSLAKSAFDEDAPPVRLL